MYEIFAYGNVDALNGIFNAIAAIIGGTTYMDLIRTMALLGLLVAVFSGLFSPNGHFHGWTWFFGFLFIYYCAFLPKANVTIIDKLGVRPPTVVANVPLGVAFFGHVTSKIGDVLTGQFETAFQVIPSPSAVLPPDLSYQQHGVLFGNKLLQASRSVNIGDPQLRTDLIEFINNCTVYDLADGTIGTAALSQAIDIWPVLATTNPARFTKVGSPFTIETCPIAYGMLTARFPAEVNGAIGRLAYVMNPSLPPAAATLAIGPQLNAMYTKHIAGAALTAAQWIRQNAMINLINDASLIKGQQLNDPASILLATSRSQATASYNMSNVTMGKLAEEALPMFRNVIEAVIYAITPFIFIIFMMSAGRGLALVIKSYVFSLMWIQLWPPLYAVLNYVATLKSSMSIQASAKMGPALQGLTLDTASAIYSTSISDQAVAGYLVLSIPIIATAIIKGGEVAFQAVSGMAALQGAATSAASSTALGNIQSGSGSYDQVKADKTVTSPFVETNMDADGDSHSHTLGGNNWTTSKRMSNLPVSMMHDNRRAQELRESASSSLETASMLGREGTASVVAGMSKAMMHSLDRTVLDAASENFGKSEQSSASSGISDIRTNSHRYAEELGVSDSDAAAVVLNARLGLGLPAGGRGPVELNSGAGVSGGYESKLNRLYNETQDGNLTAQGQKEVRAIQQAIKNYEYRWADSSQGTLGHSARAQLEEGYSKLEQARASFSKGKRLEQQAAVAESQSTSVSFDAAKLPDEQRRALLATNLLGNTAPIDRPEILQGIVDSMSDHGRPTNFRNGENILWESGDYEKAYEASEGVTSASPDPRSVHDKNIDGLFDPRAWNLQDVRDKDGQVVNWLGKASDERHLVDQVGGSLSSDKDYVKKRGIQQSEGIIAKEETVKGQIGGQIGLTEGLPHRSTMARVGRTMGSDAFNLLPQPIQEMISSDQPFAPPPAVPANPSSTDVRSNGGNGSHIPPIVQTPVHPNSATSSATKGGANAPSFPKVSPATQATRDESAKGVLVDELQAERTALVQSKKTGNTADVTIHNRNIQALEKELGSRFGYKPK